MDWYFVKYCPPPPPPPKLLVLDNIWFVLTISKLFSQIWKTKVTPFESGSCTKITAINAWKLLLIEKVRVSDPHSSGANCDIYYIISAIIRDSIRLFLPGFFFFLVLFFYLPLSISPTLTLNDAVHYTTEKFHVAFFPTMVHEM